MSHQAGALASAEARVAAVRDDPAARLALMTREWSAQDLDEPRLLELVRDGNPIYAWPFERRGVWRRRDMPLAARLLERVTRAR